MEQNKSFLNDAAESSRRTTTHTLIKITKRGKTTITNAGISSAGISKRVIRKPPGASGRVGVAPGSPAGLG
jgi:hypothetical protein